MLIFIGPTNIWVHVADPHPSPHPGIFISDMSPMNVIRYIRWFHIIDIYIVTFVGTDE
jgi:hypothetical protein